MIVSPDPDRDVTIRLGNGSIRYRDPFLAEPAVADTIDLTIHPPYAPAPVTWSVKFGHGDASLESQGDFDAWLAKGGSPRTPELQIGVVGNRWPFVARTAGVDAVGRLDGSLDFARKRGRWVFSGDARLDGLNARGKTLPGDTLVLDRFEAGWDVAEGEEGWKIRRLSVASPLGQLKAEGQLNGPGGAGKQRVEGKIDLAEIARQLPHALHLRNGLVVDRGMARIAVDLASNLGQTTIDVEAKVSDLAARDHDHALSLKDPATFNARLVRKGDDSRVERLSVHTAFLDASAKGGLEEGVDYSGTIDLGGLRKQLGEWVDLGSLDLTGRAELAGTYQIRPASPLPSYKNNLTATIKDLRVEGGRFGSIRRDSATLEFDGRRECGRLGDTAGLEASRPRRRLGPVEWPDRTRFEPHTDPTDCLRHGAREGRRPVATGSRHPQRRRMVGRSSGLDVRDARRGPGSGRGKPGLKPGACLRAKGRLDLSDGELILVAGPPPPSSTSTATACE